MVRDAIGFLTTGRTRRSITNRLSRDEARRLAANLAKCRSDRAGRRRQARRDETQIIWIERQRAFQMVFAFGKLPLHQCNAAHDAMAFGVVLIDAHCSFDELYRLLQTLGRSRLEFSAHCLANRTGLPRICRREASIEFDRAIKVSFGLAVSVRGFQVMAILSAQQIVIGVQRTTGFATRTFKGRRLHSSWQHRDDILGDLILNGEKIFQAAVIALGPEVRVARRIDQLGIDPNPVACAPHTAFEHVAGAKFPCHIGDARRLASVLKDELRATTNRSG